jgi:hypothetical protein
MIRNTWIEWFPLVGWAGTPPGCNPFEFLVPGGVAALNHRLMAGNPLGFIMLEFHSDFTNKLIASFTKGIKTCKDRRLSNSPEDHHRM